jgi:hypothetical protein
MDAAAQRAVARWNPAQAIDVATEMSALTVAGSGTISF